MIELTEEQALELYDCLDLDSILDNEEEVELLKSNNPTLLEAYMKLQEAAY